MSKYRVVEIEVIHRAAVDVDLAVELGSELSPIALDDRTQIVVLTPVPAPAKDTCVGLFSRDIAR